jgi:alanine racemase
MTVQARLAMVKRVVAGSGISYGHTYVTERDTTVAVVPVGYGDGIPRHASSKAPVLAAGRRRTIAGRVCMDQIVLDLGDDDAAAGDPVVLFGSGEDGAPTAQDWAEACGTINYEIVTRIGGRMQRRYVDAAADARGAADLPGEPSAAWPAAPATGQPTAAPAAGQPAAGADRAVGPRS